MNEIGSARGIERILAVVDAAVESSRACLSDIPRRAMEEQSRSSYELDFLVIFIRLARKLKVKLSDIIDYHFKTLSSEVDSNRTFTES